MSGIEVVGLLFATVGFIELVVAVGEKLAQRVSELENADKLVAHLSNFGVESSRKTLKLQLEIGQSICNDPHVDDGIKDVLDKTFIEIQKTLNTASDQVNSTLTASKKFRHYFVERRNRQALEVSVGLLKQLAQEFRDAVILVRTERTAHSSLFLSTNTFQVFETPNVQVANNISLKNGRLSSNVGRMSPRSSGFVLERRSYSQYTKEEMEDNIKDLTKVLASSSHSEGILDIVGYANDAEARCFNLVFAIPDHLSFQGTLQNMICKTPQVPPLNVRILFCCQLAEAVLHVHRLDLVHKNISSANIAVMKSTHEDRETEEYEGYNGLSVFLLNWHLVRRASDASKRVGETSWWNGIYCHPKRQMEVAEEDYSMGHDLYSMGACMFEVLIWKALVEYSDAGPVVSSMFRDRAARLGVLDKNRLQFRDRGPKTESQLCTSDPLDVQVILKDLAQTELPAIAGSRLSSMVVSCLTCLEGGFPNLSFSENNRIETGMNFIVSVKAALAQISV